MSFTKINWGGLIIETVYSQPDFTHESERLKTLKEKVDNLEACSNIKDAKEIMETITENDRNYLCSPVLDALVPVQLWYAAKKNSIQAVIFLVERGLRIKENDLSLKNACINKNMEMVRYLYEKFSLQSAIKLAILACTKYNNLEALQFLTEKFVVRQDSYGILTSAFLYGHKEIYEFVYSWIPNNIKDSLRYREYTIINNDNVEAVKFLADKGHFRDHIQEYILLSVLTKNTTVRMFEYLLSLIPNFRIYFRDNSDRNPLLKAIEIGHIKIVKYILEELEMPMNRKVLLYAVYSGDRDMVQYFLDRSATHIEAALETAVRAKKFEIAEILRIELCKKSYFPVLKN